MVCDHWFSPTFETQFKPKVIGLVLTAQFLDLIAVKVVPRANLKSLVSDVYRFTNFIKTHNHPFPLFRAFSVTGNLKNWTIWSRQLLPSSTSVVWRTLLPTSASMMNTPSRPTIPPFWMEKRQAQRWEFARLLKFTLMQSLIFKLYTHFSTLTSDWYLMWELCSCLWNAFSPIN